MGNIEQVKGELATVLASIMKRHIPKSPAKWEYIKMRCSPDMSPRLICCILFQDGAKKIRTFTHDTEEEIQERVASFFATYKFSPRHATVTLYPDGRVDVDFQD